MKRKILIIILFICSFPLYAQIIDGYGLKAGLGIANNSWEYTKSTLPDLEWDNGYGISIRAFADFLNFQNFQIEGELAYSKKGAEKEFPYTTTNNPEGDGGVLGIKSNLEYLSFALMAKLKIEHPVISPYLLIGPQLNYLLSQKYESSLDIIYDNYRDNVIGLTAGMGAEINLLLVNLIVEYRYEKDLKNNYTESNLDIKNYSHTILTGVKF